MKNTKKLLIFVLSLFIIFAFTFANVYAEEPGGGEDPGTQEPTEPDPQPTIEISGNSEVEVGKTITLDIAVTGIDDVYEVEWSSSNESVATVDAGTITGVEAGTTTITAKIVGTDASDTYSITVKEKEEKVTDYKLVITGGTLDKKFDPAVTEYTVTVTDLANLDIDVTPDNAKKNIPSYSNIKNGSSITVTIEGKQYKINFVVPEANTNLASLKITGQSFNQAFDKDTTSYTLTVPYEINEIEIKAEAEDSNATIKGTGYKDLSVGSTTFTITVTNGTATKTYKIFVTREEDEEEETTTKKKTKKIITNKNTSNAAEFDIPDVDDPDSTLNMIIITLGSMVLFAGGVFGIYFYIKTSPRRLKKEVLKNKNKKSESPMVETPTVKTEAIKDYDDEMI